MPKPVSYTHLTLPTSDRRQRQMCIRDSAKAACGIADEAVGVYKLRPIALLVHDLVHIVRTVSAKCSRLCKGAAKFEQIIG